MSEWLLVCLIADVFVTWNDPTRRNPRMRLRREPIHRMAAGAFQRGFVRMDELATLLSRVALRDRRAFARFYELASPKLFGIALRILKDRAEAEEALQEIFIKVWQRAERYDLDQSSPMTWLSAIARNHAIDVIRARKPQASDLDQAFDIASAEPGPEALAMNASEGSRIERCMRTLESDKADAVRKAYVEGLSYQELADFYKIPLNTMRTWLRRSLLKLRECLDP
jgi:RNA polymerase sigma-70 factor, ECF subfamily